MNTNSTRHQSLKTRSSGHSDHTFATYNCVLDLVPSGLDLGLDLDLLLGSCDLDNIPDCA